MRSMLALAFVSVGLLLAGCKSTGVDQAGAVAESLRELAVELDRGPGAIDGTVAAAKFDAKGDLKAQHKAYVGKVDDLESQAAKIRSIRADIMQSRDEFVKASKERDAAIQNPELRAKAAKTKEELVVRFNALAEQGDKNRAIYEAMMKDLRDVQVYLESNLNAAGIEAVESSVKHASEKGNDLKKGIDGVLDEMKKLADELDVPPPPPPPAPAEPAAPEKK